MACFRSYYLSVIAMSASQTLSPGRKDESDECGCTFHVASDYVQLIRADLKSIAVQFRPGTFRADLRRPIEP